MAVRAAPGLEALEDLVSGGPQRRRLCLNACVDQRADRCRALIGHARRAQVPPQWPFLADQLLRGWPKLFHASESDLAAAVTSCNYQMTQQKHDCSSGQRCSQLLHCKENGAVSIKHTCQRKTWQEKS